MKEEPCNCVYLQVCYHGDLLICLGYSSHFAEEDGRKQLFSGRCLWVCTPPILSSSANFI